MLTHNEKDTEQVQKHSEQAFEIVVSCESPGQFRLSFVQK
jgi:hypothetical protein